MFPALLELEQAGSVIGPATGVAATESHRRRNARDAGRLPNYSRGGPRRDGGRLRGGAGVAGPPRGLEGLPARRGPDPKHSPAVSPRSPGSGRLHHTNIVPVFGVGEHVDATTTRCSSSRARASTDPGGAASAAVGALNLPSRARQLPSRPRLAASVAKGLVDRPVRIASRSRKCRHDREGSFAAEFSGRAPERAGPNRVVDRRLAWASQTFTSYARTMARVGLQVADGAGIRARPGDSPSRHQAVEPAAGYPGQRLGDRLRPGQVGGCPL